MIAFVLSGGGNRGALQAGALQVLLERGIRPDMVVGTSAGALNSAWVASDPSPAGMLRLTDLWKAVKRENAYPGTTWSVLWRLLRGAQSLYPNDRLVRFLRLNLRAAHLNRFGDIPSGVRLYIIGARLDTGEAHVFGDDPEDAVLDALMASTALVPFHPPWTCAGVSYVDGGLAANLPVRVAYERGAKDIFALHVARSPSPSYPLRGASDVVGRAVAALLEQQYRRDLGELTRQPDARLHYIPLKAFAHLPLLDFSHSAEMVACGRAVMQDYLDGLGAPRAMPAPELGSLAWLGPQMVGGGVPWPQVALRD